MGFKLYDKDGKVYVSSDHFSTELAETKFDDGSPAFNSDAHGLIMDLYRGLERINKGDWHVTYDGKADLHPLVFRFGADTDPYGLEIAVNYEGCGEFVVQGRPVGDFSELVRFYFYLYGTATSWAALEAEQRKRD